MNQTQDGLSEGMMPVIGHSTSERTTKLRDHHDELRMRVNRMDDLIKTLEIITTDLRGPEQTLSKDVSSPEQRPLGVFAQLNIELARLDRRIEQAMALANELYELV